MIEEDVIKLERGDASNVRWMCSVRPEDKAAAGDLRP